MTSPVSITSLHYTSSRHLAGHGPRIIGSAEGALANSHCGMGRAGGRGAHIVPAPDSELRRPYRLYKRMEVALALPAGPERSATLHSAMIDGDTTR